VKPKYCIYALAAMIVCVISACSVDTPSASNAMDSIRDSKLFDRRIKETPRQKVLRECQQECDRYRVDCKFCHTTNKVDDIQSDKLALNAVGNRAQIMRTSPSFGLNQDCAVCHQSKFHLNRAALKLFGPGGAKRQDAQNELKADTGLDDAAKPSAP
jgi:hypothetical protein